jgi:hypothetical protein
LAASIELGGRYRVTLESVVADRERTDILVYSLTLGDLVAVLELKKCPRSDVEKHLPQLQRYADSLNSDHVCVQGYLIALDSCPEVDWTDNDRAYEQDRLQVRLVHIGKQPPSQLIKRPSFD